MKPPSVSVIIPTYNGLGYVKDCLASIGRQARHPAEIIVVDNGSADETVAFLQHAYPDVRVVSLPTNCGYAGGGNAGARTARGEWLVFLNNDTVVEAEWLEELMAVAQRAPQPGVCTSKIRLLSDRARLDAIGSYLTPLGFLRHVGLLERDEGQYDQLHEIFSPKGVAFAIRRALFHDLGGFDERYFAYFEESDLFWRVWLSGARIVLAPRSVVYHKVGGTAATLSYAFVDYHSFKNRLCTILKNAGGTTLAWMVPLHVACCLALAILNGVRPRRWANAGAILHALGWNVVHARETWRARQVVQRHRRLSDRVLFRQVVRPIPVWEFARYVGWMVVSRERMRARHHGAPTVRDDHQYERVST